MKPVLPACISVTAGALLTLGAAPVSAAATAPAQATPAAWKAVNVPSSVTEPATLGSVSAASLSAAWAVGADAETSLQAGTPLILHWNGRAWSKVALSGVPGPGYLTSVSAGSASDAWAVGTDSSGVVALHWNGRNWRTVSFPDQAIAIMASVAVEPDGTAWLAGGYPDSSGIYQSLLEKWNGKAWHVVKTGLSGGALSEVRVSPSGEVFVQGPSHTGGNLVAYEQGGTWTSLPSPPVDAVNDVLGVSANDVWVTGILVGEEAGPYPAKVCHWNGSAWTTVNAPTDAAQSLSISPDNAGQPQWVGASTYANPSVTAYAYYNGTSWSNVSGATDLTGLYGAATVTAHIPGTNATWAVGGSVNLNSLGEPTPAGAYIEYNPACRGKR